MERSSRQTREGVLDAQTRKLLLGLINKGALDEVGGETSCDLEDSWVHPAHLSLATAAMIGNRSMV